MHFTSLKVAKLLGISKGKKKAAGPVAVSDTIFNKQFGAILLQASFYLK